MTSNTITYTNISSILLKQINKLRNHPKSYIPILKERKTKYDKDNKYFPLEQLNFSIVTHQGVNGVDDLITFLQNQRECSTLKWSYELHCAADKRAKALSQGYDNRFNRVSQLQIGELVSQVAIWKGHLLQLTFYGFIDPRQFLCELLIDDGHPEKENREQFFNHRSNYLGIGISEHETYKFVIVLIFAMHVEKKKEYLKTEYPIVDQEGGCGQNCNIY